MKRTPEKGKRKGRESEGRFRYGENVKRNNEGDERRKRGTKGDKGGFEKEKVRGIVEMSKKWKKERAERCESMGGMERKRENLEANGKEWKKLEKRVVIIKK